MRKTRCWLCLIILTTSSAYSQKADSVFLPVDSVFTQEDSLSIFELIDSLLNFEKEQSSQLAVRLGYNSNVLSAGRTLGIQNFGLAPGISYYHKTGLYADITSYWSKDFDPKSYLSVASLGYMHDFSRRFSLMAEYDKYFYNLPEGSYVPYKNTLSATPIIEFKPVSLSVNYSFYFGDQYAHRIMPGIFYTFEKRKVWKFSRIAIMPAFFMLMGNETISTIEFVRPTTIKEAIANYRAYGTRFKIVETQNNVFGIMNYAFSVPISLTFKNWGLSFSYTYNIPKALPGEPLTLSKSTYLSGSLMYIIDLRRHKNTL